MENLPGCTGVGGACGGRCIKSSRGGGTSLLAVVLFIDIETVNHCVEYDIFTKASE